MIAIDSKSYPYLAVAQHCELDYAMLLKYYSLDEIYDMQKILARDRIKPVDPNYIVVDNIYAKEVWNAAIEKAAKVADNYSFTGGKEVLKLKII